MTDRTAAKRVAAYTARSRRAGLVRVTVWVPKDRAEEIRQEAARMRALTQTEKRGNHGQAQ